METRFRWGWAGFKRFITVMHLFLGIFWAFYSLKFKRLWRSQEWVEARRQELYVSQARHFRETAVALGGLLIKLGQFFSTRVDLLPQVSTRELAGLQDEVEPVAFEEIQKVAEAEFGRSLSEVYARVEKTPLASASLGQVHLGVLNQGDMVAIKIQRPGIENLVDIDLRAIRRAIDILKIFTEWEKMIDFEVIYQEFTDTTWEELDYIQEGHNAETIARNSAQDPDLIIPRIYWDYTTSRVLTMEFKQGIKVSEYAELERAGVSRAAVARKLLQTYIRQILIDGFFHADPHPGNLLVTPAGQLIMLDFGMMGSISPELRDMLIEIALGMVERDNLKVVEYLKRAGFLRREADDMPVARALGVLMEGFLGDPDKFNLASLLEDLEQLLFEHPFQIPANVTFLGRALSILYGLCVGLDPDINFLEEARPFLTEFTRDKDGLGGVIKNKVKSLGGSLVELPVLAERFLRRVEDGDLVLKVQLQPLTQAIRENTRAMNSLGLAVVFGFLVLASAYMRVNHLQVEAGIGFIISGIVLLIILFRGRPARRWRAPHPPITIKRGKKE